MDIEAKILPGSRLLPKLKCGSRPGQYRCASQCRSCFSGVPVDFVAAKRIAAPKNINESPPPIPSSSAGTKFIFQISRRALSPKKKISPPATKNVWEIAFASRDDFIRFDPSTTKHNRPEVCQVRTAMFRDGNWSNHRPYGTWGQFLAESLDKYWKVG